MKSKYKLSLIVLLGIILFAACGSEKEPSESTITTTIKGGRTGGAWSVFTEGIAESIRREHTGSIITVEPGSIVENPPFVGVGKVPYALSYAMTAYAAYHGKEPYKEKYEDIRAVSVIIPANYYQFFVEKDTVFDSFDDLIKSKEAFRLSVNQKGSAGEQITREVLRQYGVSYEDIISWGGSIDYLSGSKAFEMMADGRVDAAGNAESAPSGNIIEASTMIDLKMLSLEQEIIQELSEELGMVPNTISAGTYDFLDEDIHTVSTPAILTTHKDVSEDEVYEVTKSIYENLDYLHTVHEEFKELAISNMADVGKVPLHPGAEKFFKEMGIID